MPLRPEPLTAADSEPWLALFVSTRLVAAGVALGLLALLHVSDADTELAAATVGWTAVSLLALRAVPGLDRRLWAWLADGAVALLFVWLSTDWRSPFYVYALSTLVLPATALRFRPAVGWGVGFTAAYFVLVVVLERVGGEEVRQGVRLEIAATHLVVPLVVVLALAHATLILGRLRDQQQRSERLAIRAERQRLAWELHDSAKQRVHAAHLILSAINGDMPGTGRDLVDRAMTELGAATGDMDTTVGELRSAVDGRPVGRLIRERAEGLSRAAGVPIEVHGELPDLPEAVAAHVYRVAAEGLTNAVRHARASHIEIALCAEPPQIRITDDGDGIPESVRPGSHGLRSMRHRAETIGAELRWISEPGHGTTVVLDLPTPIRRTDP